MSLIKIFFPSIAQIFKSNCFILSTSNLFQHSFTKLTPLNFFVLKSKKKVNCLLKKEFFEIIFICLNFIFFIKWKVKNAVIFNHFWQEASRSSHVLLCYSYLGIMLYYNKLCASTALSSQHYINNWWRFWH